MPDTHVFPLPQAERRSSLAPAPSGDGQSLARHVQDCYQARGAWHGVRCQAEWLRSVLSGRVVSTVVAAAGLLAIGASC